MSGPAIKVENLSKRYRIGAQKGAFRYGSLRDTLMDVIKAPFRRLISPSVPRSDTIWALKDVSFEVQPGEVVGIIGRNGAGKTTLLKVLARITEPTEGRAVIRGRIGSLLEVGTGFHPELTGRENIYLSGAILGMKRKEIERKFDEIVAFAELEKFLETPVKRYSSGMYVRLAFAVAAHLDPEILFIDEVLAVGDAAFQKKCLGKMDDVAKTGHTVLFVSHNMAAIENLCAKACLLESGRLIKKGPVDKVIHYYLERVLPGAFRDLSLSSRKDRSGSGQVRLTSFHIETPEGAPLAVAQSGMDIVFVFGFRCSGKDAPHRVDIGFSIHLANRSTLCILYSSYTGQTFETIPSEGEFRCHVRRLPFASGRYFIGARVTVAREEADWPRNGVGFIDVEAGDFYGTGKKGFGQGVPFLVSGDWCVEAGQA